MNLLTPFLSLLFGTFVSEDLACITAGLLIQRGEIGIGVGILGCAAGIFAGDFGLWAIGRVFGAAALSWPWLAARITTDRSRDFQDGIRRHAAGAIIGSRFLPGTRLPLYVIAGVLQLPGAVFALWAFVATLLWTPTVVLLSAALGDAFVSRLTPLVGLGWTARVTGALIILSLLQVGRTLVDARRRRRVVARVARWSRWEFWPMWVFYGPVVAWVAVLSLRHRSLATMTAANPGMRDGGTVGESKSEILAKLPDEWTIPYAVIEGAPESSRIDALERIRVDRGWSYPLILKPDVGQRGVGVKLVRGIDDVRAYFAQADGVVILQPYHPGPFEAGVFYYRFPGWQRGKILSITDKHFPVVVGDGRSTLEDLIWQHPRYRLQGETFVARHRAALRDVPAAGERVQLAIAGNHAQGTLFRDGTHLLTPALEQRIDEIAKTFDGFFVGRFDIRYSDVEQFKAGRDLAIVELNGATSESTNIYDPGLSLFGAYRTLFTQWSIVFAVGAENRRRGAGVTSLKRLIGLVRAHFRMDVAFEVSD
jgi:membrane protein DedA with SNARE-associated domain